LGRTETDREITWSSMQELKKNTKPLFRVNGEVRSKKCSTGPTLLEMSGSRCIYQALALAQTRLFQTIAVQPVATPKYEALVELGVFDFAETSAGDVVDEAADSDTLGNPWMGTEFLQLVADIFIDVLEGVEEGGSNGSGPGAILDSGAQILFARIHQSAVSVIDHHEFLGAE
jgi:hypothetical protein